LKVNYFGYFAEIIRAVGGSTTGLVALFALIAGVIALVFFRDGAVPIAIKLLVFLLLVSGFGLFVYKFYDVTPTTTDLAGVEEPEPELAQGREPEPDLAPEEAVETELPASETVTPPEPQGSQPTRRVRVDCGRHWTGWIDVGGRVGSPCPSGCERGEEVGQSVRMVGFPPRPQVKHKFQCWRWEEQ
jgi:hypothetical protein